MPLDLPQVNAVLSETLVVSSRVVFGSKGDIDVNSEKHPQNILKNNIHVKKNGFAINSLIILLEIWI